MLKMVEELQFSNIVDVVDGLLSLAILIYFVIQNKKEVAEMKAEIKEIRKQHTEDLKLHSGEYAGLLEKSLVALRDMSSLTKDQLAGMESRLKDAIITHRNRNERD